MKRSMAVMLEVAGVLFVLLGLLFLAGSAGQLRRVMIGMGGLALGAISLGYGIRWYRRAEAVRPEILRADILAAAEERNGEISGKELEAVLGWRMAAAEPVLHTLMSETRCQRQVERGGVYYTFPELQPRLMLLRCEYCNTEFELNAGLDKCPNCGGVIKTQVAAVSLSKDEVFHMGDE